jgi:hypothetical protein
MRSYQKRKSVSERFKVIVAKEFGGLIRHRMPLRREFPPFLFGGSIGCVFRAFLAPNRLQVIFLR